MSGSAGAWDRGLPRGFGAARPCAGCPVPVSGPTFRPMAFCFFPEGRFWQIYLFGANCQWETSARTARDKTGCLKRVNPAARRGRTMGRWCCCGGGGRARRTKGGLIGAAAERFALAPLSPRRGAPHWLGPEPHFSQTPNKSQFLFYKDGVGAAAKILLSLLHLTLAFIWGGGGVGWRIGWRETGVQNSGVERDPGVAAASLSPPPLTPPTHPGRESRSPAAPTAFRQELRPCPSKAWWPQRTGWGWWQGPRWGLQAPSWGKYRQVI